MITKWSDWRHILTGIRPTPLSFLFLVLVFFVAGAVLSNDSLRYPWYGDDFHLVRCFSGNEIAQAFSGDWDKDGIETPGYRPLTVAFNAFRGCVFGESVFCQRLFQIGLLAAFLAVAAIVAMNLGLPYWGAMFAGLFTICGKNNWWNLVWIVDGVHALTGLLLISATML